MTGVSFKSNLQNIPANSNVQKRLESQENFGAIDRQMLEQSTAQIAQEAQNQVKENWIFSTMRNVFGVEDPKKTLKSIGYTLLTVVGLAFLGNKMSNKTAHWGLKVDEVLSGNKLYQSISNAFKKAKSGVGNFLKKSKTVQDISETLKTRKATPKADMTRGYGRGFVSIFSLTPVDTLKKAFNGKTEGDIAKSLKNIVGEDAAGKFAKMISGEANIPDNRKFCQEFSNAIRKNLNCKNNADFLKVLEKIQKGDYGKEFTKVNMSEKGLMGIIGSWWPVNIIRNVGKKLKIEKLANFGLGNLGDSLIKFNAVNGTLADTTLGKLTQKAITVPTESISNFVNDKSGLGAFLAIPIVSLWNNTQDAPKGQKVATVADDFIGTIGSIAISTPLAFSATYGLASMKNLEGKTIFSRVLKQVGKFFGMGLDSYANDGTLKVLKPNAKNFIPRKAGGALRFFLVMFAFAPLFSKPIKKVINKIFGKPYDAAEAEKQKQIEEQKNTVIPELGITAGEFEEKIKANPNALARIQNDPMLAREIKSNPKLLVDLLDGKKIQTKPKDKILSPANAAVLNGNRNLAASQTQMSAKKIEAKKPTDTATYVPSSEFVAKDATLSAEQQSEYEKMMADADKVLKRAERYI